MKRAITLLFFVISMSSFAQSGITKGAKWAYLTYYFTGTEKTIFTYNKDTVIKGQTCAVLADTVSYLFLGVFSTNIVSNSYSYIKNDSMYWFIKDTFRLVNIFNRQVGDTVDLYYTDRCDSFLPKLVVDSIKSRTFSNNIVRKITFYRVLSSALELLLPSGFPNTFVSLDGVGWINSGPSIYATCYIDDNELNFACYKDDSISTNIYPDCFKNITSIDDSENEPSFLLSNWVKDKLELNITSPTQLSLFDINGKLLIEKYVSESLNIDMSNYPTGLYILKAETKVQYKTYKVFKTL